MQDDHWLAERFEGHRRHLRSVAYRILGSASEADDAVQEAWIRLSRSDSEEIENLGGWLTTVVARVSLNMLQSRRRRREESLDVVGIPEPLVDRIDQDPEHEALLTDSVGLALLVVLESLGPEERLALVLHDMFAVPFTEIARIVERTPEAARQLASRARRRVQAAETAPDSDLRMQRQLVEAFLEAAREGDFRRLLTVLAPNAILRADLGPAGGIEEVSGAEAIAGQAMAFSRQGVASRLALVNGAVGVVTTRDGEPVSVAGFTIRAGQILAIDITADPDRIYSLDLSPIA